MTWLNLGEMIMTWLNLNEMIMTWLHLGEMADSLVIQPHKPNLFIAVAEVRYQNCYQTI